MFLAETEENKDLSSSVKGWVIHTISLCWMWVWHSDGVKRLVDLQEKETPG